MLGLRRGKHEIFAVSETEAKHPARSTRQDLLHETAEQSRMRLVKPKHGRYLVPVQLAIRSRRPQRCAKVALSRQPGSG